jgi:hypothetical protein
MARSGQAHIQIEGYRELQKALRQAQDQHLPKELGHLHKEIGRFIVSRLEPPPVPEATGRGAGATVRPSASKRELLLSVGGAHRVKGPPFVGRTPAGAAPHAYARWGRQGVQGIKRGRVPPRPHIVGTALNHQAEIRRQLLDGIVKALEPAFQESE